MIRPKSPRSARIVTWIAFLLLYVPLIVLVIYSFVGHVDPATGSRPWTLDWYRKAFSNRQVLDALRMSLYVGFWSMLGATVVGTMAALAISRTSFPGRKAFDALIHL